MMKSSTFLLLFISFVLISCQRSGDMEQISYFGKFEKVKLSEIHPDGWIKTFLERQRSGLTGNIEVAGYPFNTCMWACEKMEGSTKEWWPYEQTSYYLDGVHRLGILLNDQELMDKALVNINYVLENIDSSGRYATKLADRWWRWPYASFNRILMTRYEETSDEKILTALKNHYLTFNAEDFCDDLELANVEELGWLYEKTRDTVFLNMAEKAYKLFKSDIKFRNRYGQNGPSDIQFASDRVPDHHGVVYLELAKVPALLYKYTGDAQYLKEAENALAKMEKYNALAGGLPSTTEHFELSSETGGYEICNTAVFPYTYGLLLRVNGDAKLGDKIEKAVFNAGIGSVSKDFKSHQYFSAPNQIIADAKCNPFGHSPSRMAFLPGHDVECCTGNVNRFMPYFVEQMWLSTKDKGLVANLYGPSSITTKVGDSQREITVRELTAYPFTDSIVFEISTRKAIEFPFLFRIPAWCKNAGITVNGSKIDDLPESGTYYALERKFRDGDRITLTLPAEIKLREWPENGISVERGPLVFSLPVEDERHQFGLENKSTEEFPGWELKASANWNYTLAPLELELEREDTPSYPWDEGASPLRIRTTARRVKNWTITEVYDENFGLKVKRTPAFPDFLDLDDAMDTIELVPYGNTMLRITVFPKSSILEEDLIDIENDITGTLKKFPAFKSRYVDKRNVDIWLPPSYRQDDDRRYPVLYMHDGQVLFEKGRGFSGEEWEVDETMTALLNEEKIHEAIVVGIWNTPKRFLEYAPEKPFLELSSKEKYVVDSLKGEYGGELLSDNYLKFITRELKPFVDSKFKTLKNVESTFMMGSSMGGLITIYALAEYPEVFGGVACLSTHFPILLSKDDPLISNIIIRWLRANLTQVKEHRVYFDYGTETLDALYEPHQMKMDSVMQEIGYIRGVNWETRKFEGAEHSEIAWKKRLDIPLSFLLGKTN